MASTPVFSYKDALMKGPDATSSTPAVPVEADSTKVTVQATSKIGNLILDAGPLITQTYNEISSFADHFFTTPAVHAEIRDENSRANLALWGDNLIVRQPKAVHVKAVVDLAKRTGDYAVLSITDMSLLALCRELDVEEHGGSDEHLRKMATGKAANMRMRVVSNVPTERILAGEFGENTEEKEQGATDEDGWAVVTAPKKKGGRSRYTKEPKKEELKEEEPKKEEPKQEEPKQEEPKQEPKQEETEQPKAESASEESTTIEPSPAEAETEIVLEEDEDDEAEGWITTENLEENLLKENGETLTTNEAVPLPAAVSTGDFAMQNVALQMGLNLVNPTNGRHITQVKSWMLRCHACFRLTQIPRNGIVKQFCPSCGQNSLMRCTVKVSDEGQIKVFLRRNMQWSVRGNKFSLPNPQSHKSKRYNRNDMIAAQSSLLLSEDQKEYARAVKHDLWRKRQNEKLLDDWIGPTDNGSVDNVVSPFAISGYKRDAARHTGVRVGGGRYVNSVKRKQK